MLYGEFDGNSSPLLTDLDCNGTESNLFVCSMEEEERMCDHSEDAGVRCGGERLYLYCVTRCTAFKEEMLYECTYLICSCMRGLYYKNPN